ncbi:MAG: hypothetical protein K9L75_03135, partial [Spirochaetia bacterium]|nr:hypothetical protein [Spirochaetia bacterium]
SELRQSCLFPHCEEIPPAVQIGAEMFSIPQIVPINIRRKQVIESEWFKVCPMKKYDDVSVLFLQICKSISLC